MGAQIGQDLDGGLKSGDAVEMNELKETQGGQDLHGSNVEVIEDYAREAQDFDGAVEEGTVGNDTQVTPYS